MQNETKGLGRVMQLMRAGEILKNLILKTSCKPCRPKMSWSTLFLFQVKGRCMLWYQVKKEKGYRHSRASFHQIFACLSRSGNNLKRSITPILKFNLKTGRGGDIRGARRAGEALWLYPEISMISSPQQHYQHQSQILFLDLSSAYNNLGINCKIQDLASSSPSPS